MLYQHSTKIRSSHLQAVALHNMSVGLCVPYAMYWAVQFQLHVSPHVSVDYVIFALLVLFCCVLSQPRFRTLWERYCRGVQAIVYVVDAADHEAIEVSNDQNQIALWLEQNIIGLAQKP